MILEEAVLEFPKQETTDPDPIVALQRYIKETIPDSVVLGLDSMETFQIADGKAPVFYCRLCSVEKERETNTVVWMKGKLAVHVLCPTAEIRLKMIMVLANRLSVDGEVNMLDDSPMTVKELQVEPKEDYLKEGQLHVTVHYGLLRYKSKPHRITGIEIIPEFS